MRAISPSRITGRTLRRLASAALLGLLLTGAAFGEDLDRVVLRVNDRIVTLQDFRERLAERERAIARGARSAEERDQLLSTAPTDTMREMMDEALLLSRGDQLAVEITPDRIDAAVEQTRQNMGMQTDADLDVALQQWNMTRDEMRARLRDQIMVQEVLTREVRQKIKVSEEELQKYYRDHPQEFETPEQTRLRSIVVLDSAPGGSEAAAERAGEIYAKLGLGAKLEDLAAKGSADKTTSGLIDLGWVKKGELDPVLEAAVRGVAPGGYSKPARGRGGWHILQVMERKPAKLSPYSEVQDELLTAERQRRFQSQLQTYMSDLEHRAYVQADPPAEAANFRAIPAAVPGSERLEEIGTEPPPSVVAAPAAAPPPAAPAPAAAKPAAPQPAAPQPSPSPAPTPTPPPAD